MSGLVNYRASQVVDLWRSSWKYNDVGTGMELVKNNDNSPSKTNGSSKPEEEDHQVRVPTPTRRRTTIWKVPSYFKRGGFVHQNRLTLLTILAVILGIALGFSLRYVKTFSKREVLYISFPGEIFLRMLKCLILPLVVSSLISALGSLDTSLSGKIGSRAVAYYICTTLLAIIIGIILVVSIQPGSGHTASPTNVPPAKTVPSLTVDTLLDLLRNMFPPNIVEAAVAQTSTTLIKPKNFTDNSTNNSTDYSEWDFGHSMKSGSNILGLVVFSVVLGITLGHMRTAGEPLLQFVTSLSDAMMIITKNVIWLSPIGVLFLIAGKILEMEDLSMVASQVGLYTVTVLVGLLIHGFIMLPLIYFIFVRKSPLKFICNMGQAIATAFGTSSSSATLPVTIACIEDKNGIDPRISRFCLPIGATINMDGTALYEAVAAIFIAQVRQVPLTVGSIIGISITATAASIGAAGIPQAGLVTMVMVLNVVGLPAEDVALIFVVDWLLDRFRTAINVLGDSIGSGIVAHLSVKDLENLEAQEHKTTRIEMTNL